MKLLNVFTIILFLPACFIFQVKAQNDQAGDRAEDQDTISSIPSAAQLINLFNKMGSGKRDPFQTIPIIASQGNNAIPALQSILDGQINQTDSIAAQRNSLYVVMVLEAIGTAQAFTALMHIASQDYDPEIRGHAMNTLAAVYNQIAQGNRIITNDSIIMLFAFNADDTTQVKFLQKSIGKIACEGIFNWTGVEWEEPMTASQEAAADSITRKVSVLPVKRRQRQEIAEAHRQWWQDNRHRFTWNPLIGRFDKK